MSGMTLIKLSGPLIREFGREHRRQLDSGSVNEAFRALCNTLPGFAEAIARLERLGMRFAIFRNRRNVGEGEFAMAGTQEVRIVPVLSGGKRAGMMQVVIGVVLIAAAVMTGGAVLLLAQRLAPLRASPARRVLRLPSEALRRCSARSPRG